MKGDREGMYFRDRNGCLRRINHVVKWWVPILWSIQECFGKADKHAYTLDEHLKNLDIKKTKRMRDRIAKKSLKKYKKLRRLNN